MRSLAGWMICFSVLVAGTTHAGLCREILSWSVPKLPSPVAKWMNPVLLYEQGVLPASARTFRTEKLDESVVRMTDVMLKRTKTRGETWAVIFNNGESFEIVPVKNEDYFDAVRVLVMESKLLDRINDGLMSVELRIRVSSLSEEPAKLSAREVQIGLQLKSELEEQGVIVPVTVSRLMLKRNPGARNIADRLGFAVHGFRIGATIPGDCTIASGCYTVDSRVTLVNERAIAREVSGVHNQPQSGFRLTLRKERLRSTGQLLARVIFQKIRTDSNGENEQLVGDPLVIGEALDIHRSLPGKLTIPEPSPELFDQLGEVMGIPARDSYLHTYLGQVNEALNSGHD